MDSRLANQLATQHKRWYELNPHPVQSPIHSRIYTILQGLVRFQNNIPFKLQIHCLGETYIPLSQFNWLF